MNVQTVVPFVDLKAQYHSIRDEVRAEVDNVFESTQFILGDAVEKFERDFAGFLGVKHVLGVGSGLDALRLWALAMRSSSPQTLSSRPRSRSQELEQNLSSSIVAKTLIKSIPS
jgi:hypothetical protein